MGRMEPMEQMQQEADRHRLSAYLPAGESQAAGQRAKMGSTEADSIQPPSSPGMRSLHVPCRYLPSVADLAPGLVAGGIGVLCLSFDSG
jgi:hypothetical protein